MTRDDFDNWLEVHTACFPGVDDWLRKMGESKRVGVLTEWFHLLWETPAEDAIRASRAMHADDNLEPKGHGKHPVAILRIARSYSRERARAVEQKARWFAPVDGDTTFACRDCHDCGLIECFHPKTIAEIKRAADGDRVKVYRITRACDCKAGEEYARQCGVVGEDDMREVYRDGDGIRCQLDPNNPQDRAQLLGSPAGELF